MSHAHRNNIGVILAVPGKKKAAYLSWHKLLSMTNAKHCPLMRLNRWLMSIINWLIANHLAVST
jgi:hypothetical protein